MTIALRSPAAGRDDGPPVPIGLPFLAKLAFDGADLTRISDGLIPRIAGTQEGAAALLDLSTIAMLEQRRADRLELQSLALRVEQLYRQPPAGSKQASLRVLAFLAPGDFLANLPVEFLLANADVQLDMVYVAPGIPFPDSIPEHDVALVAVAESDENQPVLRIVADIVRDWPVPVVNAPDRIARLTRDGTWNLLNSVPGVVMPVNMRIDRAGLTRLASGDAAVGDLLAGEAFPIIVRPTGSHAGHGLAKIDDDAGLVPYLADQPENDFYIAPFVDYRSADGQFRKYRVALIDGRPYACHMAISDHWMVHYLNAGMTESASKRAEEARFMAGFDHAFAVRHAAALRAIAALAGLDYLPLDCAETRDGRLLIFESGTNMIVHSMDPPDLFPYKKAQMDKVFRAFETMLRHQASGFSMDVGGRAPRRQNAPHMFSP
jgi:hypothetical protein